MKNLEVDDYNINDHEHNQKSILCGLLSLEIMAVITVITIVFYKLYVILMMFW